MLISYSQNLEDVMLWRALEDVQHGFYIDVGANDPSVDSVTRLFYDRGWHGINIEPLSHHVHDLQRSRPHDLSLQIAIGASEGEIQLWETDVRGWATADPAVVDMHQKAGHEGTFHTVQMQTLKNVCKAHVHQEVHFLKIDVEGLEKDVLSGADFQSFRPWIVLIEATLPNSTVETYPQWEELLTGNSYTLAYADGLNRFYAADEHAELLPALRYPPNVFDNFKKIEHVMLEERVQLLEGELQRTQQAAGVDSELHRLVRESVAQLAQLKVQLDETARIGRASTQNDLESKEKIEKIYRDLIASEKQQQALLQDLLAAKQQEKEASTQLEAARSRLDQTLQLLGKSEESCKQHAQKLDAVKQELHQIHQANHHHWLQLGAVTSELSQLRQISDEQMQLAEHRKKRIEAMQTSRSWRSTAGLRWCSTQTRLLQQHGLHQRTRAFVAKVLRALLARVEKRPKVRAFAKQLVNTFGLQTPARYVHSRLRPNSSGSTAGQLSSMTNQPTPYGDVLLTLAETDLNARAQHIYGDLQLALKNKKTGSSACA